MGGSRRSAALIAAFTGMSLMVLFSVLGSGSGDYFTDSDGDGISDGEELDFVGTDPFNYDTDFDGAGDGEEYYGGYNPIDPSDHPSSATASADPYGGDPYADGTGDPGSTEPGPSGDPPPADSGPDPSSLDSDDDGLTDAEEINGLPVQVYTFSPDGYGPDAFEGQQGTWFSSPGYVYPDPNNADSDGDLWPDGFEYFTQHNPTDPDDGNADNDGDFLSNGYEYTLGTNWEVANTDGDVFGLDDGIEVLALGTNPLDLNDPADEPQPDPVDSGADPDPAADGGGTGGSEPRSEDSSGVASDDNSGSDNTSGGSGSPGNPDSNSGEPLPPLRWWLETSSVRVDWTPIQDEDRIPDWDSKIEYTEGDRVAHKFDIWTAVTTPSVGEAPTELGDMHNGTSLPQPWSKTGSQGVVGWKVSGPNGTTFYLREDGATSTDALAEAVDQYNNPVVS